MRTVIIDLDGICFDPTERLERCKKEDGMIDWDKAFSSDQIVCDPVIKNAEDNTHKIYNQYKILYLTGRSQRCCAGTKIALFINNNFAPGKVYMRFEGDTRPDHELKQQRIEHLREIGLQFIAAIDDNYNGTLKPMYEGLGIPCFTSFDEFFESKIWKQK